MLPLENILIAKVVYIYCKMTFSIQENRKKKKSLVTLERSRWWPTARQGRLAAGARAERGGQQHGPREAVVGVVRARASGASGRQALCSLRTLEPAERGAGGQAGGASGRCIWAVRCSTAPRPEPARGGGATGRGSAGAGLRELWDSGAGLRGNRACAGFMENGGPRASAVTTESRWRGGCVAGPLSPAEPWSRGRGRSWRQPLSRRPSRAEPACLCCEGALTEL